MEFLIVFIWILCASFSSYIASQKNRDAFSWFFVGLLFGIFGLIAIVSIPQSKETTSKETTLNNVEQSKFICKNCGRQNPSEITRCLQCATKLNADVSVNDNQVLQDVIKKLS